MKTIKFTGISGLSLLFVLAGLIGFMAPQARADEEKDPPSRVARISYIDGSVSLQPGGQGDWGTAVKNRPVTIGDKIWVDKDARAELEAGQASIHLGSMSALSFLNLDEAIIQMRLPEGSVNFRVRELREGDVYEVDTPNVVFTVKQAGAFRIDVSEDGASSRVTVIRGEGEILADGKTYPVHAGEQAEFNGEQNPTYSIAQAPGPDGLDRWAQERDEREDKSASGNYVSRDMPGYSDLDENGTWSQEPDYGNVWYPNDVGPEWAPYSDGNWNYVEPWGWTWIGYEPWGFAPYHYGRWGFIGGRWGWCPGPYFGPPIYGPAFVGWLGGGWGFGVGFGVGWFPLGWGEPFHPWYHCGPRYLNVINVHNTFIRNVNVINAHNFNYVNAHNVRAVTTTSHNSFVNGDHIRRGGARLTEASLRNAKVTNSVGLKPTQHSSLGMANMNGHVARPSAGVQNRSVMARTAPAAGASHLPVHTFNGRATAAGRFGNSQVNGNAGVNARPSNSSVGVPSRQRELSQSRPPSAMGNSNRVAGNNAVNGAGSNRPGNNSRVWEAQGNSTDRGHAPQGFGSDRPANSGAGSQTARNTYGDRPPWARGGAQSGAGNNPGGRAQAPTYNNNRPNYSNGGRSYTPPQRNYTPPQRSYNPPSSPRTYSPPSRSYPAPSRSYSPPSHSSGGGGGSRGGSYSGGGSRGSGGGGSHGGGGGGSHSSGGGGSHGGGRPH